MGRLFVIVALTATLGACITNSKEMNTDKPTSDAIQALLWVVDADPKRDAEKAITQGDYRLLVPAGRGQRAPGVTTEERAKVTQLCGVKILPGSTDVVRGDRHLALLQKAHAYAAAYNAVLVKACLNR